MDNLKAEIISGLILTLLVVIKFFKQTIVHYLLDPIVRIFSRQKLDMTALSSGRMINNLLLELRVKMNADRATIFLFHNGQHFNPKIINNSIWKFTCAYEICKAGVTYESINMQGLLVTNHLQMIESLWGKTGEGYEKYDCPDCNRDCYQNKNIVVILDSAVIPYGNTKNLLEIQGIKKLIISPIVIQDDYVGFIGVSYSSNYTFGSQVVVASNPLELTGLKSFCEYANTISFYLSQKR